MKIMLTLILLIGPALAEAQTPEPPPDPQRHVEQILDQPMYNRWKLRQERAEVEDSLFASYLDEAGKMLDEWIEWLFGSDEEDEEEMTFETDNAPPSSSGGLSGLLEVIFWIAVIVLSGFLVYVIARMIAMGRMQSAGDSAVLTRQQVKEALDSGEALAMPSGRWLDEAGRFAEENDLRSAFRALYLALLAGLHERRKIDFRRNRTNWIYVRHYRGPQEERQHFNRLTRRFDTIWYGQHQPDEPVLRESRARVSALLQEQADG